MAKFVIECPQCGRYTEASKGFFAKKTIDCACGYKIHVKTDKMTSRYCPHCGNNVVFDQSKGDKAICPVCKEKINAGDNIRNKAEFTCPSCSCNLVADKNADTYTCPLCETVINVQERIEKEKIKNQGLASVIKYEGDNQTLVWKHPIEDFNYGSQLIVHESQEAIFFRDGQALDLFGAGRHSLVTQNLPLIEKLYKIPTNADTIFHSEIYFINMTTQMGIKWGTDSKVRFYEPVTGIPVEIGANGQFNIRVKDSRKLLVKLVGTANEFTHADVVDGVFGLKPSVAKFKAMIMTTVKSNLARIIKENSIDILEIDSHLDELSLKLCECINTYLEDYGLFMPEFFVTSVMTPDDDPNFKRLKQQHADLYLKVREEQIRKAEAEASAERQKVEASTAASIKVIGAQGDAEALKIKAAAEAAEMRMKGFTYQQETARQVGLGAVENMGGGSGGSGIADVAGLGVALGAMGGVMNMTKDTFTPAAGLASSIGSTMTDANVWDCECGNRVTSGSFCNICGKPRPKAADTWDCECGNKGVIGNFCNMCGKPRPKAADTWDCECGNKGVTGNFCNMCGKPRPAANDAAWDCPECGHEGNTGNFCNNCGHRKGE